jgi:hypothetical protein
LREPFEAACGDAQDKLPLCGSDEAAQLPRLERRALTRHHYRHAGLDPASIFLAAMAQEGGSRIQSGMTIQL